MVQGVARLSARDWGMFPSTHTVGSYMKVQIEPTLISHNFYYCHATRQGSQVFLQPHTTVLKVVWKIKSSPHPASSISNSQWVVVPDSQDVQSCAGYQAFLLWAFPPTTRKLLMVFFPELNKLWVVISDNYSTCFIGTVLGF